MPSLLRYDPRANDAAHRDDDSPLGYESLTLAVSHEFQ
ncbi:Uncharacterised protein [Vibrio cholerae]|nr:Uncharacterised protein [Vibrio cholerae]